MALLSKVSAVDRAKAVAVVRRHRVVMLGMPRIRKALPDLRPERTA